MNTTEQPSMYRALRLIERELPTLYGREAKYRAPITHPSKPGVALIPSWTWTNTLHQEFPEGEEPVTCDINGAFLAATGAVEVAFTPLSNTGRIDANDVDPRYVWPGYYRITTPSWAFDPTIVSPLGNVAPLTPGKHIWIAHPTLVLLLELMAEGSLGEIEIHEAWVAERKCNFRTWNAKLKVVRNNLLDIRDAATTDEERAEFKARYKAFKEGYGMAFNMMLTGEKTKILRPDWTHAVYAQHAAAAWRKAWRLSAIGPVLSMGRIDEITILRSDLQRALTAAKPPVKWDATGRILGHFKEKEQDEATTPREYADAASERAADFFTQDFGAPE